MIGKDFLAQLAPEAIGGYDQLRPAHVMEQLTVGVAEWKFVSVCRSSSPRAWVNVFDRQEMPTERSEVFRPTFPKIVRKCLNSYSTLLELLNE